MNNHSRILICLMVSYFIILIGGFWVWISRIGVNVVFVSMATIMGVVTFFGVIALDQSCNERFWAKDNDTVRTAITASFMVVYFFLLAMGVFASDVMAKINTGINDTAAQYPVLSLSPITQVMITNFTYLMGVVIAFYFSTPTIERIFRKDEKDSDVKRDENNSCAER